jgi:putative methanogen marker protein 4
MPARRIGVGVLEKPHHALASIEKCNGKHQLCVYTDADTARTTSFPCPVVVAKHPERALIDDLYAGNVAAAVRGSLPSHTTLAYLKQVSSCTFLERIVLLETGDGKMFFLCPVGIDEGYTISEKVALIEKGRVLASRFSLSPVVGVLSGGRHDDYGRHPYVDALLDDARELSNRTGAVDFGILIEDAVRECGLIIAPNGVYGNMIFRTLALVGNGKSHGAQVVNLDRIFVDTSRANPDYIWAFELAAMLYEED